jgi:hypothetical protein
MARYGNSITKTTGAAAAPIATLSTGSARDVRVWEVGISVSTAVSGEVGLMRPANSPATPSGGQVGAADDPVSGAGVAVTANAWATAPTVSTGLRRMVLPATIGAGVIWTFEDGLVIPVSSYLVLWQYSALAVTYSAYFVYDE